MYQSYDFTYAGMPASMYGMFICDIGSKKHSDNSFGNKAEIIETRLARRITPLHYGVSYHSEPLTFSLIFGSEQDMDRYQMQEIAKWLTGYQDYQWLSIDQPDLEYVQFRCLIQSLTPISVAWLPVAFEAEIVCDCPYGYSYPFEQTFQINGRTPVRIYNDSTCRARLRPQMVVNLAAGNQVFCAENRTTGSEPMEFRGLPSTGLQILIDNENCIMTEKTYDYDLYPYFNFKFFELDPGDNEVIFQGKGTVTLRGRYLYNVGA